MSQQGSISQNDLMHKLVQAKKVMNKVDSGNYERGNVDESLLRSAPEDVVNNEEYQPTKQPTRQTVSLGKEEHAFQDWTTFLYHLT